MVELTQLWLPILLTGIVVFFVSFLMWMVFPHHRSDWRALPDEDGMMGALREMGARPGQYTIPHCADPAQMKDPDWMKRYEAGPKGYLVVLPEGNPNMAVKLGTSFLFNVLTAVLVAYLATMALDPGASKGLVFRFVWTAAFLANSFGLCWGAIWFGRSWSSTLKEMFDGLVYGAATGALFALLWPAGA